MSLSRIIQEVVRIKSLYKGKLDPVLFFDITPVFDDELESYCSTGSSALTLKIAKRLAQRSPEEALKAILGAQKRQNCGHCGKPFYIGSDCCDCYEYKSDPSQPFWAAPVAVRKV